MPIVQLKNKLGIIYLSQGRAIEAKENFERAIQYIRKQHKGEVYADLASFISNLGAAYQDLGNYRKAEELLMMALKMDENNADVHPMDLAMDYNRIGHIYQFLGKFELANSYLEKALAIEVEQFGEKHPSVVTTLAMIGNSLYIPECLTPHYRRFAPPCG